MKVRVGNAPSKSQYISEMFGPCVNGSLIHGEFLKSIRESCIVKKTSVLFMAKFVLTQHSVDWRLCQVSHWWLATVMWSAIQPSVRLHALCPLSQMLHRVSKIWGTCDKWKLTFSPNFLAYINRKHCIKAATRYFHSCWFWQPLWIKVEWAPPPLVAKILARCATVLEVTECKMQHIYYTIFLFLKERFTNKCQFSHYLPPAIPMEKQVKFSSPLNIPGTVL